MTELSVAVCLPSRDQVCTGFMNDAFRLAGYFGAKDVSKGAKLWLFTSQGTLIANQRQELVFEALQAGCSHILFLDTDMRFPKDTLDRLLAHDEPIVAANYATRRMPVKTVAFSSDQGWDCVYTTPESEMHRLLGRRPQSLMATTAQLVLCSRSVFSTPRRDWTSRASRIRSEEHTSELQSH